MSKELENLITKALKKGYANKNGRMYVGSGTKGELESKWELNYSESTGHFDLSHWGTQILAISGLYKENKFVENLVDDKNKKPIITDCYGQSKSDRDALMCVFDYFGLDLEGWGASYRPSLDKFIVTGDFTGTRELTTKNF